MTPGTVGKVLDYQARQIAYNVYTYYKKRKLEPNSYEREQDINIIGTVSIVTGLSKSTVTRVIQEGNSLKAKTGVSQFMPKEKKRHPRKKKIAVDEVTEGIIREKVIQFYTVKKEVPSVRRLNFLLKEEKIIRCSNEYLRQLLHKLGFTNSENEPSRMVMERRDVASQRLSYLQAIKDLRAQNKTIFFLNLTKFWQSLNENEIKKMPSIIIVHASGNLGFLDGVLLMCKSRSKINVDADSKFESIENYDWIKDSFLPNIPPSSVVVMNIPYCETIESAQHDEKPTFAATRRDMQEWLCRHNISFRETAGKSDLFMLINSHQSEKAYRIDKIVKDKRHEVLYLPVNHIDLNPVVMVWEKLKGQKSTPKVLFSKYSKTKWQDAFERVEKSENEYYENDINMDEAVDKVNVMNKNKKNSIESEDEENTDSDEMESDSN